MNEYSNILLSNVRKVYQIPSNNRYLKFRSLRDVVTDAYVEIFFRDVKNLTKMVNFVYHYINDRIEELKRQVINERAGEDIIFFFKGGNIMFFWRQMIGKKFKRFTDSIKSNTKISDNDFTIYIISGSEERHNEIYSHLKPVIVDALLELGKIFDFCYKNVIGENQTNRLNISRITPSNNNQRTLNEFLQTFYSQEKINRFKVFVNQKLRGMNVNNRGGKKKYFKEESGKIFAYTLPDNCDCNIIKRKNVYLYPNNNINFPQGLEIKDFGREKYHYMSINQSIFNNLSGTGHLVAFDLFRIKFNLTLDNCKKSDDMNEYRNNTNVNNDTSILVPSEFIDISIPKYFDRNLSETRERILKDPNYKIKIFSELNTNFVENGDLILKDVKIMSMYYILEDLLITLFSQNQFNPFLDIKYKKRIFRTFYFYFGYMFEQRKPILNNPFNRIYDLLKNPNEINTNNLKLMLGKLGDFFEVKDEVKPLSKLINFTVIFNLLCNGNNDDLLIKYLEHYNKSYNIIERIDIDDFKNNFDIYLRELREIYQELYQYFFPIRGGAILTNPPFNPFTHPNTKNSLIEINKRNKTNNKVNLSNKLLLQKFLEIDEDVNLVLKPVKLNTNKLIMKYSDTLIYDD